MLWDVQVQRIPNWKLNVVGFWKDESVKDGMCFVTQGNAGLT